LSQPDSGQPENASGAWPYGAGKPAPGHPYPGDGTPGSDTQPYEEWRHAGAVPDDSGGWGPPPEYGAPPGWPGEGTYVPGDDDGQPPRDGPPGPMSYGAHQHDRKRRPRGPLVTAAALVLGATAAITVVTFSRNNTIRPSPADYPGAAASQRGLTVETGPGHGGTTAPAAQPPAITKAEARQVLSAYWRVSNKANEQRSDSLLATIEAGTSLWMDTGAYRFGRASDPSNSGYAPFEPVRAAYYIPRLAADDYPRWFVAAVTYARLASPQHPTGSGYLLFKQASPGAAWKDALEPDVLPGGGPAPRIATGADGYAAAASPARDAAGLSIAPSQIGLVTAASLDGSSATAIKAPGNLTDLHDEAFWRSRLPAGSSDTDKHQPRQGRVFGLRTESGGALLFYSLTAQLNLVPPPGETFRLTIPGYYTPSKTLPSARVGYIEQFAAYDPPQGQNDPLIAADASGIASRD
jgi:hypothetical protein